MKTIMPAGIVERKIHILRGRNVMLNFDLAKLYGVSTGNLNKAAKRNLDRFPTDFMFRLNAEEYNSLRFQIGILEKGRHSKYLPYAFTEQGVAMLSSVLKSKRAIHINVMIMRVFVKLRGIISSHKELADKLDSLEKKYDSRFKIVFDAIKELALPPQKHKPRIGLKQ